MTIKNMMEQMIDQISNRSSQLLKKSRKNLEITPEEKNENELSHYLYAFTKYESPIIMLF